MSNDIDIESILQQTPLWHTEEQKAAVSAFLSGQTILITGGGGSFGAQLAQELLRFNIKKLIIIDHHEAAAFTIKKQLTAEVPQAEIAVFVASVQNKGHIEDICLTHKPTLIFHAAAYKHVQLMEENHNEAIRNNVFGSQNIAEAAISCGAKKCILVSTDKAVDPKSIYGATKRLSELLFLGRNQDTQKTTFTVARFGNMLGSSGSVFRIFEAQIAAGKPLTITDKDAERYFIPIKTACYRILQMSEQTTGGEIFAPKDMQLLKITDLAEKMLTIAGKKQEIQSKIIFTTLQPGEKMTEALFSQEEVLHIEEKHNLLIHRPKKPSNEALRTAFSTLHNQGKNIYEVLQHITSK